MLHLLLLLITINIQWLRLLKRYAKLQRLRRLRVRRWWVKPHINVNVRNVCGAFEGLFMNFMENDHEDFMRMVRMTPDDFEELHNLVGPHLQKVSLRRPLPTRLRLALTLNFLAHSDSIYTTANYFRIGRSTVYSIIKEVCPVIWNALAPLLLRTRNVMENRIIAGGFRARWQLPNCVGAMDGIQIPIKRPPRSGSLFYNYKKFFSFKLLAICDAYYRFLWVNVGDLGSASDLSTFRTTALYDALQRGEANLPPASNLPRSNIPMNFFIIGDEIFTLKDYLMVPYARHRGPNPTQENFNQRLSRARNCIEDAFGIMCAVWPVVNKQLDFKLETSVDIVRAVVCLHNFRINRKLERGENADEDIPANLCAEEEEDDVHEMSDEEYDGQAPENARQARDILADYLQSPAGALPF